MGLTAKHAEAMAAEERSGGKITRKRKEKAQVPAGAVGYFETEH